TIEVTDDALVIQSERKQEREEHQKGIHRTERSYGRFYRAVPLPQGANAEQAQANFKDGVLEVKIPVSQQQSQRKKIPIQSSIQQNPTGPNTGTPGTQGTIGSGS